MSDYICNIQRILSSFQIPIVVKEPRNPGALTSCLSSFVSGLMKHFKLSITSKERDTTMSLTDAQIMVVCNHDDKETIINICYK